MLCIHLKLYNAQVLGDLLHGYHHIVIWSLLKYSTQTKCVLECDEMERESKRYASLAYA